MQSQQLSSFRNVNEALERVLETGALAALITIIEGTINVGAKLLVEGTGLVTGSTGNDGLDQILIKHAEVFLESREPARTFRASDIAPALDECGSMRFMFERIEPEPRIVICGAGHVGAVLAKLSSLLGLSTTLIDDRPEFVTRERFPEGGIELVVAEDWGDAVWHAVGNGRGVSVAVVTRGHNEDEECMRAVVNLDPDYVGLIGSKRRTNIVLQRLREAGVDEGKLVRVRAPIGLDIRAVTPEEVALSILAEIVAVRRGGKGDSLSAWRRV